MATTTTAAGRPARARKGAAARGPIPMDRFAEAILEVYKAKRVCASTLSDIKHIFIHFNNIGINTTADLDDEAILRFASSLPPEWSLRVRSKVLSMCRAVCNHGKRLGLLTSSPVFPPIPSPKEFPRVNNARPLTHQEVKAIWDYLQVRSCTWEGYRLFALFAVIVLAGLRIDEARRLETSDVDLKGGVIWLRKRQGRWWNALPSKVRMSSDLKMVLSGWLRQTGCQWVFPGKRRVGTWKDGSTGTDAPLEIKRAARAAGVKSNVTFESLRRFHIDNAITTVPLEAADVGTPEKTRSAHTPHPAPIPAVETAGPGLPVHVRGVPKTLTAAEGRIVMLLLQAFPEGLSLKGMNRLYGKKTWRQLLIRLRKDPDWFAAIGFPGPRKKGGSDLYRILPL